MQEGLRACEVSRLRLEDVDVRERCVLVRGKGGHERVLPLSDETWRALTAYLAEWPASTGPLVRSYNEPSRALTAPYIVICVGRWMRHAGVPASGHALRHTAASDMLRAGAHVVDVQAALGHANVATTSRYLPLVVDGLRQAMGGRRYGG